MGGGEDGREPLFDFTDKCAIVTGGGAGIGLAVAQAFAAAGAGVVISGRRKEKLDEAVAAIESAGGRAVGVQADVSQREDADRTIATAISNFGRVDYLINNAHSTDVAGPIENISEADLRRSLDSGLGGTLFHMQAALPHLKESKGAIVNFGSRQGTHGAENYGVYASAKEAIRGLSRVAAREFGPHGIRVNVVNPAAETDAASEYFAANPGAREYFEGQASLRRMGTPDEIASAVLLLCSDAAGYISGQTLNVDGGQEMF